ncbi:MAG: hypothetical protein J0I20_11305 [Chloroflexi bacterium]|nr:hypothetical protein [Chloroflexota bacterium]
MKLPEGHQAYVDLAKLSDYCLNPEHPRGQHKARVFASVLGFTATHATNLQDQLLQAARQAEVTLGENDIYGQRYVVDFVAVGPGGSGIIRSSWIIRTGENFPRLVTCYVL